MDVKNVRLMRYVQWQKSSPYLCSFVRLKIFVSKHEAFHEIVRHFSLTSSAKILPIESQNLQLWIDK
jgi:hypothetical protein